MTRKYDLVIFDFDGTLANTFPWFTTVLNSAADRFGFNRVDPEHTQILRGYDPQGILTHLGLPRWKLPLVAQHFRSLMSHQLENLSLFEGAAEMLQQLSNRDVTLALVTSNAEVNVRRILGAQGAAHFRHLACGTSMFGKASKVKKVRARSRVPAARTILIGDEIRDWEAAQTAGVDFGAVGWGYNTAEALQARQPTEFFETFGDIARLFSD